MDGESEEQKDGLHDAGLQQYRATGINIIQLNHL